MKRARVTSQVRTGPLAELLHNARLSQKIALEDIQHELGLKGVHVSVSFISGWECGNREPSPKHLNIIADVYKISSDDLVIAHFAAGVAADIRRRRKKMKGVLPPWFGAVPDFAQKAKEAAAEP